MEQISIAQQKHDGDLGHNATVWYSTEPYCTDDGEAFHCEEIRISDKTRCLALTPKEALSLLQWLEQEKSTLEKLAAE